MEQWKWSYKMEQQKWSYPCPLDFDIQASGRLKSPSSAEENVGWEC